LWVSDVFIVVLCSGQAQVGLPQFCKAVRKPGGSNMFNVIYHESPFVVLRVAPHARDVYTGDPHRIAAC